MSVPFESISKFNDPFVKFSLQLEFRAKKTSKPKKVKAIKKIISTEKNNQNLNKVIKLDKFRKKKD